MTSIFPRFGRLLSHLKAAFEIAKEMNIELEKQASLQRIVSGLKAKQTKVRKRKAKK